jgi:hypothetical protein
MTSVPRGGNQTGGRGRGRGGGPAPRGGPRGGVQAPPLAAQLRQLDRLQEPEEMAVLRRYKDLGASQVRSTYGVGGLLDREVCISQDGVLGWVSVAQADNALQQKNLLLERERALARQEARLPENRRRRSWSQLAPEDRRVLLLSQKEWNSFRARAGIGAGNAAQQAQATAPQAPPQGPSAGQTRMDPGEDGGDDASDAEEDEN